MPNRRFNKQVTKKTDVACMGGGMMKRGMYKKEVNLTCQVMVKLLKKIF